MFAMMIVRKTPTTREKPTANPRIKVYLPRRNKVFTAERPLTFSRSTDDAPKRKDFFTPHEYKKRHGEHKVPRAFCPYPLTVR